MKKKSENTIKKVGLFDHLKAIYLEPYNPDYFKNMSETDRKTFSTYMINRYISMNPDWLFLANYVQKFSYDMTPEMLYKVYANFIPKGKTYLKYIKGKKEKKFNKELIRLFVDYFECSEKEATEYLQILFNEPDGDKKVRDIIELYGKTEKEIKVLLKVN